MGRPISDKKNMAAIVRGLGTVTSRACALAHRISVLVLMLAEHPTNYDCSIGAARPTG